MSVTAVIVTWNSRDDLLSCLAALAQSDPRPDVVVVDNASTDGTGLAVQVAYPNAILLEQDRNRHFAQAANVGLRWALEHGAEFAWVLNPDASPAPDALREQLAVAQSDPQAGLVGARLVHPGHSRPARVVVGARCDFATGAILEPPPPADSALDRLPVDYVWGCAMLIRAAVVRQVGLFDERFVAYFEDADLCLRARAAGWRTLTALRAAVVHAGSRAGDRRFAQQMWLRGRNWLWTYWRHASPAQRPQLLMCMLGYRLPQLAWSALVTVCVRTVRPRGHPVRLWS